MFATQLPVSAHPLLVHLGQLGWMLIHFLWQGALIAGILAVLLVALRHRSAQARYVASYACLCAMALCLPITWACIERTPRENTAVVVEAPEGSASVTGSSQAAVSRPAQWIESTPHAASEIRPRTSDQPPPRKTAWTLSLDPILPWIAALWIAGVTLLSIRLAYGWSRLRRWQEQGMAVTDAKLQARWSDLLRMLRVRGPVQLLESKLTDVPTVFGWLRPIVLVPASALTSLTAAELDALLMHELAHIRRYDYPLNMLQAAIETLLFYHPAVWWISSRVREYREHCCDDVAVELCGDRGMYARALASMEQLRGDDVQLALAANSGSLIGRIRRIIGIRSRRQNRAHLAVAAGTITLVITSLLLSVPWSAVAQQSTEEKEVPENAANSNDDPAAKKILSIRIYANDEGEIERVVLGSDSLGNRIERITDAVKEQLVEPIDETVVKLQVHPDLQYQQVVEFMDTLKSLKLSRIELSTMKRAIDEGNSHIHVSVMDRDGQPTNKVYLNLWMEVQDKTPGYDIRWNDGEVTWRRVRSWSPVYPLPEPFGFHGIAAGKYRITAARCAEPPDHDATPFGASDVIEVPEDGTAEVQIELHGDKLLNVQVVDGATRKPLEGVSLRLYRQDGAPIVYGHGSGNFFERTNEEGTVRYKYLVPGQYTLEVLGRSASPSDLRDYPPLDERISIQIPDSGEVASLISLRAVELTDEQIAERIPFSIQGTVRDLEGNPVANAQIRVHAGEGTLFETGHTESREDGTYEVRFLPGIRVEGARWGAGLQVVILSAEKDGFERVTVSDLAMAAELPADDDSHWYRALILPNQPHQHDIVLQRAPSAEETKAQQNPPDGAADNQSNGLKVRGRVVDRDTGAAIDQFRVVPAAVHSAEENKAPITWQSQYLREMKNGELRWNFERPWQFTQLRIEADGYKPAISRILRRDEKDVTIDVQLQPDPGIRGQIVDPNGQPLAGVSVAIGTQTIELQVRMGKLNTISHGKVLGRIVQTDADGRFHLPAEVDEWWLVATHPEFGYAERKSNEVTDAPIQLQPWSEIRGKLLSGNESRPDIPVGFSTLRPTESMSSTTSISDEKLTAADGSFQFTHVPQGQVYLHRWFPLKNGGRASLSGLAVNLEVPSGQVIDATLGGPGRTVIGRVELPEMPLNVTLESLSISLVLPAPHIGFAGDDEVWKVYSEFLNSEEGRRYQREGIRLNPDGTFRIHDVPAGDFELRVIADEGTNARRYVGYQRVEVPMAIGDDDKELVNVGTIAVQ